MLEKHKEKEFFFLQNFINFTMKKLFLLETLNPQSEPHKIQRYI